MEAVAKTLSTPAELVRTPETTRAPQETTVSKEMFLQLLVTQIRHQNPMNPRDGAEFLAQLAQFTSLEQMMAMRKELEIIRQAITTEAGTADGNSNLQEQK